MSAPIFELDTLAPDRPTIRIKTRTDRIGKLYEMATVEDLSLKSQQTLVTYGEKMQKLGTGEMTGKKFAELVPLFHRVMRIALPDCPDDVLNELSPDHCKAVIDVFTQASQPPSAAAEATADQPPTGDSSLPDSNGSTEDHPTPG